MKNLLTLQLWKLVHPYLVIGKIALLIVASLGFLYIDQVARNLFRLPKPAAKQPLGYLKRAN